MIYYKFNLVHNCIDLYSIANKLLVSDGQLRRELIYCSRYINQRQIAIITSSDTNN